VPHVGSFWQLGEQPSKGTRLPSSQPSPASTLPLPQTARSHAEGVVFVQVQPGSMRQMAEQPSPVSLPPSSHSSLPMMRESPHSVVHGLPGLRQR